MTMVPAPAAKLNAVRILVVEDDVLIRMAIADELRADGFVVIEAARADKALSWLHANGDIDLVFSDIRMPGSLNGVDLLLKLRETYPWLPVVLTSGSAPPDLPRGVRFVPKPYNAATVAAMFLEILAASRREMR